MPDCDGPRCYFQHANLLLASGAPSDRPFKGDVHVVCFVTTPLQECVCSNVFSCFIFVQHKDIWRGRFKNNSEKPWEG